METMTELKVLEVSPDALYLLTKAEIDTQIATAKAFPRDFKMCIREATEMATLTEEIAESCCYAVPRKAKNKKTGQWETVFIEGPSVRLAEIVAYCFGNIRAGSRVIANDGKTITSQGICHDLEKNNCRTIEVKKRITDSKGNTYNDDLQVLTGNAAGSVAYRNAVYSVIPNAVVDPIYQKAKELSKGTLASLKEKREKAIKYFEDQGVKVEQVCELLEVATEDEINLEKLSILRGLVTLIKNGEGSIKDLFEKKSEAPTPPTQVEIEQARRKSMVQSCTTLADLDLLATNNPDFDADLIAERRKELTPAKSIAEIERAQTLKAKEMVYDQLSEKDKASDKGQTLLFEISELKGEVK